MKQQTGSVDVTVLHTEGCSATPPTIDLIKDVSQELDIPVRIREILVQTPEQALELGFLGSPTVQVNGRDIDPAARDNSNFGWMWRRYGASGTPTRAMIVTALLETVAPFRFPSSRWGRRE